MVVQQPRLITFVVFVGVDTSPVKNGGYCPRELKVLGSTAGVGFAKLMLKCAKDGSIGCYCVASEVRQDVDTGILEPMVEVEPSLWVAIGTRLGHRGDEHRTQCPGLQNG